MPRTSKVLTHQRFTGPAAPAEHVIRELMAVREISHAFLHADRSEDVFQFALDRVGPLVGATFASIYLVDGSSELLRLAASHNWPEKFRPWLGQMRVRLGFGPSGEAAAERRIIEVPDVLADADLEDWRDVAGELGFRSLVALPLATAHRLLGTVTFYFAEPGSRTTEARGLLRIVADQMSATAEKASLVDEMRRANAALMENNEELERQYAAVLEARKVREEFLANISHELRTPLTAVLGYIALLQEEFAGPLTDGQRADLKQVRLASERLLTLVDDLLDLTTLRRGTMELQVEEVDLVALVHQVMERTPGRLPEVEVGVVAPGEPMPRLRTDRRKLTRLLEAVVGNAYKFTAAGSVTVRVDRHGDRVFCRVADTGTGIPEGALRVIFEEFRQVDGSSTRQYGGAGLGLALARQLARLMGGDIEAVSIQGAGSTFTIDLPIDQSRPGAVSSPSD